MSASQAIDKRQMRRSFERAAATYDQAAVLQREVCARALERLDLVKLDPSAILDAGCGTGHAARALRERYPRAMLIGLDIAVSMLELSRERIPAWKKWIGPRRDAFVCGDNERLPIRSGGVDMVWSNLAFQWAADPTGIFAEAHRILRPGGLVMFTTLGPDTLKELRAATSGDGKIHVNRFIDMHDIGDMMVSAGFADPVMDMEYLTLTYADVSALMRELKALGAHNVAAGRSRGLTGKRALSEIERRYEAFRQEGRLPATFEVIYGHAWKPLPRLGPGGRPVIDIKAR
ncbi:MAG TPA: malonyl-ACP O-methyltransferase BioC [Burkholderiales bacterium]|nr:malonyl-ACP O-methyltransferase BioC [Burkholderiales bacterium]